MEEVFKSIKDSLVERFGSPFIGTFFISWIICNYKFWLIFFSGRDVLEKFDLFEAIIFNDLLKYFLIEGFLLPLIITLLYIFAYPSLDRRIYVFRSKCQIEINRLKQELFADRFITQEEKEKLLNDIEIKEENINRRIETKEAENDGLRQEGDFLREEIKKLKEQIKTKEEDYKNLLNSIPKKSQRVSSEHSANISASSGNKQNDKNNKQLSEVEQSILLFLSDKTEHMEYPSYIVDNVAKTYGTRKLVVTNAINALIDKQFLNHPDSTGRVELTKIAKDYVINEFE